MRISADLLRRIDALAAAKHQTRSVCLEELLALSIDQQEMTVRAFTDPVVGPALVSTFTRPEVLRAMMTAMKEELTDDQLHLFTRAMSTITTPATPTAPAVTPRRQRPSKKGKR